MSKKGQKWWNNGVEETMSKHTLETSWVRGRLKK